ARLEFILFLAAYLKGDAMGASYHANQITNASYAPGYLARALAAAKTGDAAGARREFDQLAAAQRRWRDNPNGELKKFIRAPADAERLVRDLADAGLTGGAGATIPQTALRPRSGVPVVLVEPFETIGTPGPGMSSDILRGRLRDALSRVDEIRVVAPAPAPRDADPLTTSSAGYRGEQPDYRIGATLEFRTDGGFAGVRFRLADASNDAVVWSRWYDGVPTGIDARPTKIAAVRDVVITLAQPNGVIQTLQRRNREAGSIVDPRYACLLDNYQFRRGYDPVQFTRVKDCLTQAVETDPTFALGFAALARHYISRHAAGFVDAPS